MLHHVVALRFIYTTRSLFKVHQFFSFFMPFLLFLHSFSYLILPLVSSLLLFWFTSCLLSCLPHSHSFDFYFLRSSPFMLPSLPSSFFLLLLSSPSPLHPPPSISLMPSYYLPPSLLPLPPFCRMSLPFKKTNICLTFLPHSNSCLAKFRPPLLCPHLFATSISLCPPPNLNDNISASSITLPLHVFLPLLRGAVPGLLRTSAPSISCKQGRWLCECTLSVGHAFAQI